MARHRSQASLFSWVHTGMWTSLPRASSSSSHLIFTGITGDLALCCGGEANFRLFTQALTHILHARKRSTNEKTAQLNEQLLVAKQQRIDFILQIPTQSFRPTQFSCDSLTQGIEGDSPRITQHFKQTELKTKNALGQWVEITCLLDTDVIWKYVLLGKHL